MQIVPKSGPSLVSQNTSSNIPMSEAQLAVKAKIVAQMNGTPPPSKEVAPQAPVADLSADVLPQENTSEETVETKSAPISPQLAMLARKEKALRVQAQQISAERAAIKAKEAEMERSYTQRLADAEKSWKSKLVEDPLAAMNESGLSYDELTAKLLNQPKPEDQARDSYTKKLEARLLELESKHDKQAKSYEDNQAAQYKQALTQIRTDATALVNRDPEFETVKGTNSVGDIVDLIEKTFKADGVLLTVEEAAKAVEEHLLEEYDKLNLIGKLKKRSQPKVAATPDTGKQLAEIPKQPQTGKTLTNNMGAARELTSRERAIMAFERRLKS